MTGHEAPQCPSHIRCNICKEEGHVARSCVFSWLRGHLVRPAATDETRAVDVDGLVSPPHQTGTPVVSQTISLSPSPPLQLDETKQNELDDSTTKCDCILDSQGLLVPESTPADLIPRPPLTETATQNRFDILATTETEDKNTEQTNIEQTKPTEPESFEPPAAPDPSHLVLQFSPSPPPRLWEGVNQLPFLPPL